MSIALYKVLSQGEAAVEGSSWYGATRSFPMKFIAQRLRAAENSKQKNETRMNYRPKASFLSV
jgi:hypothetical protein